MIKIEETEDGSRTLFVPEMNEHYHSVKGALTEAEHIFINMGLRQCTVPSPHVFEIGFGTGLNAFLTLLEAERTGRKVYFSSIERYPVDIETIQQMGYPELIDATHSHEYYAMHEADWNRPVEITPHFVLHKIKGDLTSFIPEEKFDVVYFDAFAPEKQPEMWTDKVFEKIYTALNPQAILTTYCAKGVIRRLLQSTGFTVERLPGPPAGKREILRATKEDRSY